MALASDGGRPGRVISCPGRPVADRGMLDRRSGHLARADGSSGVVAPVAETPWTSSATRDAVRHRDAESSADSGLDRHAEPPWMGVGRLITQRSRVQIPPPLPSLQVRGLFRSWKGPSCCGVLTSLLTVRWTGGFLPSRHGPGLLAHGGRLLSRFGIEAGTGGGLQCSVLVRAAGSVAVIRSELAQGCRSLGVRAPQPRHDAVTRKQSRRLGRLRNFSPEPRDGGPSGRCAGRGRST